MARFKALPFLLLVSSLIVQSIIVDSRQLLESSKIRTIVKRQANSERRDETSNNNDRLDQIGQRGGNSAIALSAVSSVSSGRPPTLSTADETGTPTKPQVGGANTSTGRAKVRPQQPDGPVNSASEQDEDIEPARPNRRRPPTRTRRPPAIRPADSYDSGRGRYDGDDEDCDEYGGNEYEYGPNLFQMATRPMRQFSNMMDSVFDQMQGMASGEFDDYPGTNFAIASSRSNSDGYSRVSSISNNNGRTRGIVSETRNGRTKTRRIGDDSDDNTSEY